MRPSSLMEGVQQLIVDVLGGEDTAIDWSEIHETLKDDVAEYLHKQTRRHPLVIPVMLEV